jgi:hypothetical protein
MATKNGETATKMTAFAQRLRIGVPAASSPGLRAMASGDRGEECAGQRSSSRLRAMAKYDSDEVVVTRQRAWLIRAD